MITWEDANLTQNAGVDISYELMFVIIMIMITKKNWMRVKLNWTKDMPWEMSSWFLLLAEQDWFSFSAGSQRRFGGSGRGGGSSKHEKHD